MSFSGVIHRDFDIKVTPFLASWHSAGQLIRTFRFIGKNLFYRQKRKITAKAELYQQKRQFIGNSSKIYYSFIKESSIWRSASLAATIILIINNMKNDPTTTPATNANIVIPPVGHKS
jgi:hypothetical protein